MVQKGDNKGDRYISELNKSVSFVVSFVYYFKQVLIF